MPMVDDTIAEVNKNRHPISGRWAPWFVLLALPTLVGKIHYLYVVLGGQNAWSGVGLDSVLDSVGGGGGFAWRATSMVRLLSVDVLEAAVITGLLFAGWRSLLGRRAGPAISASIVLLLLVIIGNIVSVQEVKTLLQVNVILAAIGWVRDHPAVLRGVFGPRKIAGLIAVPVWSALPLVVDRFMTGRDRLLWATRRATQLAAGGAIVAGALGFMTMRPLSQYAPTRFRGYWSLTASQLGGLEERSFSPSDARPIPELLQEWRRIEYPGEPPASATPILNVPRERERLRHVILIGLETAAGRYYPLAAGDPSLPTFRAMTRRGLVAERHHMAGPYSTSNYYSLVTGTYASQGSGLADRHALTTDSLPTVLAAQGYDTCLVDSYKIDWDGGNSNRRLWTMTGFAKLVDTTDDADVREASWEASVAKERRSLRRALDCVQNAEAAGRHAFVLVATAIGHYPWRAPDSLKSRSGAEKLLGVARLIDGLIGEMLAGLRERGLEDDTIVVVTGDHGLRYRAEFESVGERVEHGDTASVVPFVMQATGIFDGPIRVTWSTSHIDVAPTLLQLLGLSQGGLLQHGSSMFDPALAARVTFLPNLQLAPENGFVWGDQSYAVNALTGEVRVRTRDGSELAGDAGTRRFDDGAARTLVDRALHLFDVTAASFAARALNAHAPVVAPSSDDKKYEGPWHRKV
jgi:PAS domain-containing protein